MDQHQSTQSTGSGCGSEKSLTRKTMAAAKCQRRPKFPGNGNSSYKDLWEDEKTIIQRLGQRQQHKYKGKDTCDILRY